MRALFLLGLMLLPAQDELIEKLRSEKASEREEATRRLWQLGDAAIPALRKAAEDKDGEVSGRARQILRDLDADVARAEFSKIEDRLKKARTLHVAFEVEGTHGIEQKTPVKESGTVILKGADRIRLSHQFLAGPVRGKVLYLCDGATLYLENDEGEYGRNPKSAPLREGLDLVVARIGTRSLFSLLGAALDLPELYDRLSATVRQPPIFVKVEGGNPKTVRYRLAEENDRGRSSWEVTLWYDPSTYLPIKRRVSARSVQLGTAAVGALGLAGNRDYTETYDWTVDADPPDESFAVPAAKPDRKK